MAETVVSLALGTIRDLLVEEARFLSGVGNQVRDVETQLRHMQCFLKDMDKRRDEEEIIRNYVKEIRDLALRIEDVVETYAVEVISKRGSSVLDILKRIACILCEWTSMHNVRSDVEEIKKRISIVDSDMERLELVRSDNYSDARNQRKKWLRQTYGHEIEEDFVGMKADIDELVKLIMPEEGDRDYPVISIWGMGGLGKTTLARKIYNHSVVRRGFKAFAWTCVTQECNPRSLMQDVLKQLVATPDPKEKEQIMKMGDPELVAELYKVQNEKKCLVVLDDIWEVADWKILRPAFAGREANSKVLLTTRKKDVADVGVPHHLDFLSEEEGWRLLRKKAFAGRDSRDLSIQLELVEDIGMEIVRKCGYLPLTISVLGGILSDEDSLEAWESVNLNINSYLRRGNGNGEEETKQVLSLSYDELPYHLKPCFLYFGHFKEDETIDIENLCLLWMAEGMVLPEDQGEEESLMDVAKHYLSELANRSMVQLKSDDIRGNIKSCCLHDLMRDLCLKKSAEEEFVSLMDFQGGKRPDLRSSSNTSRASRRVSIHMDPESKDFCRDEIRKFSSRLRSIQLQGYYKYLEQLPRSLGIDLENLKLLRVLNFVRCKFVGNKIPKEISKLVNLRFLGIIHCGLVKLSLSIADLPFLQALVLEEFMCETMIPNVVWNMKRLRYLRLPVLQSHSPIRRNRNLIFGGLDQLETLIGFHSDGFDEIKELYKLKKLRHLEARVIGNQHLSDIINYVVVKAEQLRMMCLDVGRCNFDSKEGFVLLENLFISPILHRLKIVCPIRKLPHHEPDFCRSLVELTLWETSIEQGDPMEVLEKLPKLRILSMIIRSFLGEEMTCHAMGFSELRELQFDGLPNLKKWRVEKGAMPHLLRLRIYECPKLEMVPDGLKFVTSLQKLNIVEMPKEFENRVREGGQDFDKIRHVHSVQFSYL